jgi:endonuclease/exonuclease/phosphatase family metal-dependent hydrolase
MQIRAATLNSWALPDPLGHQVPERMRAIGDRIGLLDLDAIAFQEVWTREARAELLRAGRRAGLPHAWHGRATLGGGGLVVLSRYPFVSARFERFALPRVPSRPDHPDFYVGKGFVRLRLTTPSGPVSLLATHLHARYGSDVPHEYRAYRIAQIVELATALRASGEPTLLLGDFNFRETDPEYRVLAGLTGLRDAAAESGLRQPTVLLDNPYRRHRPREKRIDFVFLRDGSDLGIRVRQAWRIFDEIFELAGRPASYSDHAGVLAEIELHGRPAPPVLADREAARLAARLLGEGRARTAQRRQSDRLAAGLGWGGALLASAGARNHRLTRRRLLNASLQGLGIAALTSGVGYALLAETFAPDELRAFDQIAARLARVATAPILA